MAQPTNPVHSPSGGGLQALRLVDVLRQLPGRELDSLIGRLRIAVDESKRIDTPSQVARALVGLPEVRDPGQFPGPTRELLYRIAESKGSLIVESLPPPVEPLVARGIVFARGCEGGAVELILPIAYIVVLRPWEGDDPRGSRALIAQANSEVAASIASHYLGRPATPPLALSLEPAWEMLNDPERLAEEIEALAPLERKLLRAVEKVGGEVETEELLDLEREPMRLRGATGATPSRRGVGFALERRGFLIPVHPNRHIIPTEVAAVVGAQRRAEREAQRREIRRYVLTEDHEPRRARFAVDPVPHALAMALAVRDPSIDVRPEVGTPRSLITRFGTRFGRDPESVALIAALSRAIGLWDPSAIGLASPPGSYRVHDLGRALFEAWRRGGAWDEARPDGEVLRVATETREASAASILREMVLEALRELSDGRWAPWEAVEAYVRSDSRIPGIARLIERWAQRAGVEPSKPTELARRIALDTLHHLGVVDLGDPEADGLGPTLRITPRGRAFIAGQSPSARPDSSHFLDNHALRIGPSTRVGQVMALAPFVEIGGVAGHLDVALTQQTLSLALAAGYETDIVRARLESIAALPDAIDRLLTQASAVMGRAEYVPTTGFLWVEDSEIREMLRTRRQTADLFVDPSPPAGLLIANGVDLERLARRCRSLGVEVVVEGEIYRTRTTSPPSRSVSGARRLDSSTSNPAPASRRSTGTRVRRSSQSMPAVKRGSGSGSGT
jgi:hypothetical protein